jgi:hypothetical protein
LLRLLKFLLCWLRFINKSGNSCLLKDYHLIMERRFVVPSDPESYAGGSVSSWQIHPYQSRSKDRGQTKCSPWSCRLGVGHGANDHGGGQDSHRVVAPVKKKGFKLLKQTLLSDFSYQPPHVRRRLKVQELVQKYRCQLSYPELLTYLFSDPPT